MNKKELTYKIISIITDKSLTGDDVKNAILELVKEVDENPFETILELNKDVLERIKEKGD